MNLTPNNLDGILLIILFIFAFLAFLKGFIKEFFSTLNLVISIVVSYFIAPIISQLISIGGVPNVIVQIAVRFIVFVTILIVCSIFSSRISAPLSEKIPSSINQSLGFGFGFIKGYLILSFCFAILAFFYSNPFSKILASNQHNAAQNQKFGPKWFQDSKSYDFLKYGADLLSPVIDNMVSRIEDNITTSNPSLDKIDILDEVSGKLKTNNQESKSTIDKSEESGYNKQDLKKMQRLIEIMNN